VTSATVVAGAVTLVAMLVAGLAMLALAERRSGWRKAAWATVGVVLTAAPLVETGARVALQRGLIRPTSEGDFDVICQDHDDPAMWIVDDVFRVPHHLLPEGDRHQGPAPDRARIVVVGDSFAHGEGVTQDVTFATRLGDLVHPSDGRPVEVINVSQSRFDTETEHMLYLAYGQTFVPDVVVWAFVLNDLGGGTLDRPGMRYDNLVFDGDDFRPSRQVSTALDLAWHAVDDRLTEAEVVRSYRESFHPGALMDLRRQLGDVSAAVRAQGGRFLVVVFPLIWRLDDLPFADLHRQVIDVAREVGAETLDLGPVYQGREEAPLWASPRDHHPNAEGHRLAAEAIAEAIGTDLPHAHPAPCAEGAGDVALAMCERPGVETGLALARDVSRPIDTEPEPLFMLTHFAYGYTWLASEALPPEQRDAVRAEITQLAHRKP
jgi:hypothetical protein